MYILLEVFFIFFLYLLGEGFGSALFLGTTHQSPPLLTSHLERELSYPNHHLALLPRRRNLGLFFSIAIMINYTIFLMKRFISRTRGALWLTALLLLGVYLIFSHKYQFVYNQGNSMEPTYQDGEWMVTQRHKNLGKEWTPDKYDVVIIVKNDEELLTKRILALSGETVEIKDGQIYINETPQKDPYGNGSVSFLIWSTSKTSCELVEVGINEKKIKIPEGYVWLIGDNRSRSWFGMLPVESIQGLIVF